jgi:hypothetical protein
MIRRVEECFFSFDYVLLWWAEDTGKSFEFAVGVFLSFGICMLYLLREKACRGVEPTQEFFWLDV